MINDILNSMKNRYPHLNIKFTIDEIDISPII